MLRIPDKYNSNKVWLVKRYVCGAYYVNQEVNGRVFYKRFTKTTKKYLQAAGVL